MKNASTKGAPSDSSEKYNRKKGTLAKDRGKTPGALIPNSGLKASKSS